MTQMSCLMKSPLVKINHNKNTFTMQQTGITRFFLQMVLWLVISSYMIIPAAGLSLPDRLGPRILVNDYVGLLNSSDKGALEQKLSGFAASNKVGIAIIITDTLYGLQIADFSARIGEQWGVGKSGDESGVVITVVPALQTNVKREVFIATGYGMEGVIPDATARRIVENEILPLFLQGRYYEGLDAATTVVMKLAAGDFPASEYGQEEEVPSGAVLFPLLMVLVLMIFLSRRKRHFSSPGKNIPIWTLLWLLSSSSRGSQGSFGNFSSGRGSFGRSGGFGGGGFSGFGGGRFGGGGAGGSW
jgi:uncharacterized protein